MYGEAKLTISAMGDFRKAPEMHVAGNSVFFSTPDYIGTDAFINEIPRRAGYCPYWQRE